MIKKVEIQFFKQFKDQEFLLPEHLLLAGPNNSGKTTLLQAIAAWRMALDRWLQEFGSRPVPKNRNALPITRKDFTAIPLRAMNQLWTDTSVSVKKGNPDGRKPGEGQLISITLEGENNRKKWELTLEFRYQSSEQIYVKPSDKHINNIPEEAKDLRVVHVPPFSGIGVDEAKHDRPYQDFLIGQGKAGDILRNLLLEIHENQDEPHWDELCRDVEEVFTYRLIPPIYDGPFIRCDYLNGIPKGKGRGGFTQLDISNAGSGFHQVLLLLGFFYARPASVLLLDEPDAHLHVILQKQIYDKLRSVVRKRNCQLIVATHSEVLIDGTDPSRILSFNGPPHLLVKETERDQLRESLKRVPALDILSAENSKGILYTEGETDFNLLRAWASVLEHPLKDWFMEHPFWRSNQGCDPKESSAHFFALRSIKPNIKGILLLDGDNKGLPDKEIRKEGLVVVRWKRYEAENYLVHPEALTRFLHDKAGAYGFFVEAAEKYLHEQLPPAVFAQPLHDHDYLVQTPASKTLLPEFFKAAKMDITKEEYYLVAEQMTVGEIHDDVKLKLDAIWKSVT